MIDSNLSWKYHIESICHKISKSIGIIAKIRHYVPQSCVIFSLQLINCPLLDLWYLWLGKLCLKISKKNLTLKNGPYVSFTSVSLRNTPYPSFSNQIASPGLACFFRDCSYLLYDINRKTAPASILNQFVKTSQIHNYRTRSVSSDSFYVKFSRTDKMYAFFTRVGAQICRLYSLFD